MSVRIIGVQFRNAPYSGANAWSTDGAPFGGKVYSYYTDDETIKKDDFVVVHTGGRGLQIARVSETKETVDAVMWVHKWILTKVDLAAHQAREAEIEQRKVIEAKLKRAVDEARKMIDYEALAEKSPEIRDLLDQLKGTKPIAVQEAKAETEPDPNKEPATLINED